MAQPAEPSSRDALLSRRVAWDVLEAVAAGAYADVALERALRRRSLAPVDRGFVTELSYGAIRWRQWLDGWLDRLGKVPACKQPPRLRWLLHIGLYQLLRMERIPASAAVNTTVELAKQGKLARLAPVVNGLLRSALRAHEAGEGLALPEEPAAALAQQHSLPLWISRGLFQWCGSEQAERVARAFNQVPPLDLRVNRLRSTPDQATALFAERSIATAPISGCPHGLQVLEPSGDLRQWPGFSEGYWCVQDRAAQWVAPLLDPRPGQRVLDACAAPGGKATHLAELMGDEGEIWAVDRSPGRLQRVAANAARLGCSSIHALASDASQLGQERPEWRNRFDRILVDAPCSGLGTLARHPDARWRVTEASVAELLKLQIVLLDGLRSLLAPGGRLVYATCTIHPSENTEQVHGWLQAHPDLVLESEQQRWPDPIGGDGFYAAVITAPAAA
ncbi:Ribosomal RNA small subunit methyltransferase B [Synechococcus sp. MIT S9509]|uniref:16S rRNA (cytosine(967)-C(5))-methyltransferase n=1 Tax=Synechococcus sp. MIT S9509 TaxID=1801630 RepID=UPI0007BC65C2|nr:16S rRNA (cytosine(967)-C(5))-methyltransferase [Synechococcus sp. MIT S9509]KZR92390.1 Ribosomal RNA small subunit methyltransferase B [Synechococcus sp. MIT S9509]